MKTSHLHDVWSSPDNNRLVSKQFSFRLPVHIAAKIAALGEMYPQKNRTQIVADLLSAALDNLEENLPFYKGRSLEQDFQNHLAYEAHERHEEFIPIFQIAGPRARYRELVNTNYKALEKELGNDEPQEIYSELWLEESEFPKK